MPKSSLCPPPFDPSSGRSNFMSDILRAYLAQETFWLSRYACPSDKSMGRLHPIRPCPIRTDFQRDRDRILHSKSFRRLMHKTQVFLSPEDDHYRTRLTHTLEVTQIARTIARALRLNEDLTEAIALGHDLGHTPFGHAGESVLQKCYDPQFSHYRQSLRIVDYLERDGQGLNLTLEVRDGILQHTNGTAQTLEGQIVRLADRIAYMNHDIDDACRGGVLSPSDIPAHLIEALGATHSVRIQTMVLSVIHASTDQPKISMTEEVKQAADELHGFLYTNVYTNPIAKQEEGKAKQLLESLFHYFVKHPERLPKEYHMFLEKDPIDRVVCDYVAGMTDRYAIRLYEDLFVPEAWHI